MTWWSLSKRQVYSRRDRSRRVSSPPAISTIGIANVMTIPDSLPETCNFGAQELIATITLTSKTIKQEIRAMNHGLSNFLGAIAAWLCLAPIAFARKTLSMPGIASTPAHHIVNLSLFLIWIAGGIFLVVGGSLAFAPFKFRIRKSDPSSRPAQVNRSTELDWAWTVIPVLVLMLFLA
jgi:hypothetical protein